MYEFGQPLEVKGLPHKVATKWDRGGVRMLVDGKWVEAFTVWRPAIFAHIENGLYVFRWTDSLAFTKVAVDRLRTVVRGAQGSTASQEKYLSEFGELC